jgi:hypothetical protein
VEVTSTLSQRAVRATHDRLKNFTSAISQRCWLLATPRHPILPRRASLSRRLLAVPPHLATPLARRACPPCCVVVPSCRTCRARDLGWLGTHHAGEALSACRSVAPLGLLTMPEFLPSWSPCRGSATSGWGCPSCSPRWWLSFLLVAPGSPFCLSSAAGPTHALHPPPQA